MRLRELAAKSGVSASHLGRIERGNRFPSASILKKIAQPLGFGESELFMYAGFLEAKPSSAGVEYNASRLDPYVASVLAQEPADMQRTVIAILGILKSITSNIGFAEYVHRKYPEVDEDVITMIEDILKREGK